MRLKLATRARVCEKWDETAVIGPARTQSPGVRSFLARDYLHSCLSFIEFLLLGSWRYPFDTTSCISFPPLPAAVATFLMPGAQQRRLNPKVKCRDWSVKQPIIGRLAKGVAGGRLLFRKTSDSAVACQYHPR